MTGFVQTCEKIYQKIEQINKTIKSYIAAITKCSDFFMNTYNVRMLVHCNYRGLWAIQAFQRKNNILF